MTIEALKEKIRDIPDFPKKGIVFKDITPLLKDSKTLKLTIDALAAPYQGKKVDTVCAIEARGFIFGGALAKELDVGFVPIRKKGKLPYEVASLTYELEYGQDTVEVHVDAITSGKKILMIDDLLATGGTMKASCELIERMGGEVIGVIFLVELSFLKGREKLKQYDVKSLIVY